MGRGKNHQSGSSGGEGFVYASDKGMAREDGYVERQMNQLALAREPISEMVPATLATEPADSPRRLRLLSLDGGYGIRPISSLIILKYLMDKIHPGQNVKPCDYFDLIGGSGTGGILALMLGRLCMSIPESIAAYRTLSTQFFQPRRQRNSIISRIADRLPSKFDAEALVKAFGDLLQDAGGRRDARLVDPSDSSCKVFVTAATKRAAGLQLHLLRTYRHAGEFQPDLSLTQACHAALAASELVSPCSIAAAGFSYVAGLPGWNNPTPQVLTEAAHLWPDREVGGLISLGVGSPDQSEIKLPKPLARSIVQWAEDGDRTARQFERGNHGLTDIGSYVRLSAAQYLVGLEGDGQAGSVQDATERYLHTQHAIEAVHLCVTRHKETVSAPAAQTRTEPEAQAGPVEEQAQSPPYEEKDEELVPYSAVMGETSEKKHEKPGILLSAEEEKWLLKHNDQLDENPDSLLPLAARDGHLGVAKMLLNRGVNINARDRLGRTAVHVAVEKANEELLQLLLDRSPDLNLQDDIYETALLKAAKLGHASIGLKLLTSGADPEKTDSIAWTPLSWACARGDERLVRELAPRARPREDPTERFSPLAWARRQGRSDIARVLEISPVAYQPAKRMPANLAPIQPCHPALNDALPATHTVPIRVNACTLPAQICTASETTVMTLRCAKETDIARIIDKRYAGRARGIGSAAILGRVHLYSVEINGVFYSTNFTIIDNEGFEAVLGLDFLRRFQGTVDYSEDTLTLRGGDSNSSERSDVVNVVEMEPLGGKGKGKA